jgi:phosphomannomutase
VDGDRRDDRASKEDEVRLRRRALAWLDGDPDPATRAELEALLDHDPRELGARFAESVAFGTAGMRAPLGAGPARMNRAVMIRCAFGLMKHLLARIPDPSRRDIAVGFDARLMSRTFAEDVAGVFAAAGFRIHLFGEPVPTPLLAFSVKALGAAAGMMITASHNPASYNGFKIYGSSGAQIVAPEDAAIAAEIERAPGAGAIARKSISESRAEHRIVEVPGAIEEAYLEGITRMLLAPATRPPLRIAYTPLHGVGHALASRAFAAAGFDDIVAVSRQVEPDPAFPTTPFPNPEEPGTLDLAAALAHEIDADLVIAHDPDADRLAVMVPRGDGSHIQLSGNQVGVLLGHYLLTGTAGHGGAVVIASIVSSPMLGAIAGELGAHYEQTLTGFKWIMDRAIALEQDGLRFLFGYEEALGYAIGDGVRDKDGISAGVVFAELCAVCRARGESVLAYLERLYRQFGFHASSQKTIPLAPEGGASRVMEQLRRNPPARIGDRTVLALHDYAKGIGTLPPSDVLAYELESGTRVIVRPSGTEPKVKCYIDHREPLASTESLDAAAERARLVMDSVGAAIVDVLQPSRTA